MEGGKGRARDRPGETQRGGEVRDRATRQNWSPDRRSKAAPLLFKTTFFFFLMFKLHARGSLSRNPGKLGFGGVRGVGKRSELP